MFLKKLTRLQIQRTPYPFPNRVGKDKSRQVKTSCSISILYFYTFLRHYLVLRQKNNFILAGNSGWRVVVLFQDGKTGQGRVGQAFSIFNHQLDRIVAWKEKVYQSVIMVATNWILFQFSLHRETYRDALLEFVMSSENWSVCLHFQCIKKWNHPTSAHTKKFDRLLVNYDRIVN